MENKTYPSILDHFKSVIDEQLRNDLLECYDPSFTQGYYEQNTGHELCNAIACGFDWEKAKYGFSQWRDIFIKAENNEIPCHPIQQVEKEAEPDLKERIKELEECLLVLVALIDRDKEFNYHPSSEYGIIITKAQTLLSKKP